MSDATTFDLTAARSEIKHAIDQLRREMFNVGLLLDAFEEYLALDEVRRTTARDELINIAADLRHDTYVEYAKRIESVAP